MLRSIKQRLYGLLVRLGLIRPGKIMYIGGSDTLPPPLSREEEAQLLARLDSGGEAVRQTLIERNLRLVVYIAKRFENTGINIEDLISIGTIGLIKGISSYRPEKNVRLATYAARCIENAILPPSVHMRRSAITPGSLRIPALLDRMYHRLQQLPLLPGRTRQLFQLPVHRFRMHSRHAHGQLLPPRFGVRGIDHCFHRGAPPADVRHLPSMLGKPMPGQPV